MTSILSPQLSEQDLSRALDAFRSALGADAVLTEEHDLDEFRDPFAYPTWDDYTASAVVMPETVEQVQAVVRIANECKRSALDVRPGQEQRLRRPGAAGHAARCSSTCAT